MNTLSGLVLNMSVVVLAGIFSRWKKAGPDLDQQVLDQLKTAGSDLSKPHDIDFFLYFKDEETAGIACREVEAQVDTVSVKPGASSSGWLCFAKKKMVPNHNSLVTLRKRFEALSARLGGEYDGWGTEVVK